MVKKKDQTDIQPEENFGEETTVEEPKAKLEHREEKILTSEYTEQDLTEDGMSQAFDLQSQMQAFMNEKFDIGNMALMCKDNSMWFAERVNAMIRGLVNKMSSVVATEAVALTGVFASGDTNQDGTAIALDQKVISTKKADGSIDPDGYSEILYSATNANYKSVPFVFGVIGLRRGFWRAVQGTGVQ